MKHIVLTSILVFALASCSGMKLRSVERSVAPTTSSRTQIVLLGTGTPNADPQRSGPALAVVVDGTPYLVDCGPGVVRRAAAAHLAGIEALEVSNLKHLFHYPSALGSHRGLSRRHPHALGPGAR